MQQGIIEKNHMDILWHDYALNKEDTIPITKAGLIEKASVVGRWHDASFLWNRSMACSKLYEYPFQRTGNQLYRRHRPDVH